MSHPAPRPFHTVFCLVLFLLGASRLHARFWSLDISSAANRGFSDPFDGQEPGPGDEEQKNALKDLPVGSQYFRGIPFHILDPAQNSGHSFLVLRGKALSQYPQGMALPFGNQAAAELYFLQGCRWASTGPDNKVAEYDVVYIDSQVEMIPLRVERELVNFWGADDTVESYLAWWHKDKGAETGLNLLAWPNPRPNVPIQSILFKSEGKAPVPMLFAVTASDTQVPVTALSPKPEKTYKNNTTGWFPVQAGLLDFRGTPLDISGLFQVPVSDLANINLNVQNEETQKQLQALRYWGIDISQIEVNMNGAPLDDYFNKLGAFDEISNGLATIGPVKGLISFSASLSLPVQVPSPGETSTPLPVTTVTQSRNHFFTNLLDWAEINGQSQTLSAPISFSDQPWVLQPESSIPLQLIIQRSLDKPFGVRWSTNWPNEYIAGLPLWMAVQQCLQGWSACLGKGWPSLDVSSLPDHNSFIGNPLISSQWPLASLAVLRGDIKEGKVFVLPALSQGQTFDTGTALSALAHRSGLAAKGFQTDISGKLKAKIQPKTKTFVSDTGQLTWQGNVGVVKIESPRFQALMGFLGHRKFNNATWAMETSNTYGSFALVSLTQKAITVSDHLILSAVSRCENSGMVYNEKRTKVLDLGKEPVLMEPVQAKFVVYRFKKDLHLKVRALDQDGKPMNVYVPSRWVGQNFYFSWVPGIFYLEVFKK